MAGVLYLVATPIGNLEDITLRALRILKEADLIACEDTRQTRKLLERYDIHKPLVSYHEHNEAARAEGLVEKAAAGSTIAVLSDAGMPGISDPGYRVVRRAIEHGVKVVPVPGAVAAAAALAVSGLPSEAFRFGGFLPARAGERRRLLASLASETATLVFYEAPHRILAALEDVSATLGSRSVVVAREMTKLHEEFLRGPAGEVLEDLRRRPAVKGEITLLIARAERAAPGGAQAASPEVGASETPPQAGAPGEPPLGRRIAELMRERSLDRMAALKQVARERGLSKREAYRRWQGERNDA